MKEEATRKRASRAAKRHITAPGLHAHAGITGRLSPRADIRRKRECCPNNGERAKRKEKRKRKAGSEWFCCSWTWMRQYRCPSIWGILICAYSTASASITFSKRREEKKRRRKRHSQKRRKKKKRKREIWERMVLLFLDMDAPVQMSIHSPLHPPALPSQREAKK